MFPHFLIATKKGTGSIPLSLNIQMSESHACGKTIPLHVSKDVDFGVETWTFYDNLRPYGE